MDGGEKDRQELSLWGEICSFCSSKSQNVTVPEQLLFSWPQPRGCQAEQNHPMLLSAQKRGENNQKWRGELFNYRRKSLGRGESRKGKLKLDLGDHWRRRKSSFSSQHKREVQHQNPALCRERAAGSGFGLRGMEDFLVEPSPPLGAMLIPFISLQILQQRLSFKPRLTFKVI